MNQELSKFFPTFLEESFEGLEVMELGLLDLDTDDSEQINTIFRAAHSIKGGSGMFGFENIMNFTHDVEALLDELRSNKREFTDLLRNLLLEAVDCIRTLIEAVRDGIECNDPQIEIVSLKLKNINQSDRAADSQITEPAFSPETPETDSTNSEDNSKDSPAAEERVSLDSKGWCIRFVPESHMLMMGNDLIPMIAALKDLGEFEIRVNTNKLPSFTELNPEELWLDWEIELYSDCESSEIEEIFEWVEFSSEININPLLEPEKSQEPFIEQPVEQPSPETVKPETVKEATPQTQQVDQKKTPQKASGEEPLTDTFKATAAVTKKSANSGSIRVGIDKVDDLMNRVGELVITQSMLGQVGRELVDIQPDLGDRLHEGLMLLERNTRDLQDDVMRIRMLPMSFVFNRFPRMVHDISNQMGKKVNLKISGEQTELDKTVMEKIGDPLVHLVRNSMDHGLELPDERLAAGKDEVGTVHLNAYHQGGQITIEITDDGRGLDTNKIKAKAIDEGLIQSNQYLPDEEIHELIFEAGLSTASEVTDLSGRGVGMDVVRRNIESLGGHVSVRSQPRKGTTFSVSLPLTLAILDGQLITVSNETYIVPLVSVIESMHICPTELSPVAGESRLFLFRDEYISIIHLRQAFGIDSEQYQRKLGSQRDGKVLMVVVEGGGQKAGLIIDDLQGQQQIVIKSLETNYKSVPGLSGATILGNGDVALVIDVAELIKMSSNPDLTKAIRKRNASLDQSEAEVRV